LEFLQDWDINDRNYNDTPEKSGRSTIDTLTRITVPTKVDNIFNAVNIHLRTVTFLQITIYRTGMIEVVPLG
jgi:hypothetical protein